MKYLQLLVLSLFIIGCSNNEEPQLDQKKSDSEVENPTKKKEELVEIKGTTFTQYYPGKEKIKFQGTQDEEKRRHGKWTHFSEDGKELGTTMYKHGILHGHMVVKRPNGTLYYHGEMHNGKKVGIWKNYDETGAFLNEDDFGEKE